MSESRAKRLQHLLVQGLVIVFSILVAFVAEDWRSGREDQRAVDEALAALTSEVETNAESLERFVDVVTGRHERLVALAPTVDGSRPFSDYTGGFTGYRLSGLDRSAWGRISADPVANRMASTQLREAFTVYHSQEILLALDGEISRLVYGPLFNDPDNAVIGYSISERILSEQISQARRAAALHRAFLEQPR